MTMVKTPISMMSFDERRRYEAEIKRKSAIPLSDKQKAVLAGTKTYSRSTLLQELEAASGTPLGALIGNSTRLSQNERQALRVLEGLHQEGAVFYGRQHIDLDKATADKIIREGAQSRIDALRKKRGTYNESKIVSNKPNNYAKVQSRMNMQSLLRDIPSSSGQLGGSTERIGK